MKTERKPYGNISVVRREDGKWGVVNVDGEEIVPFGKYEWIDGFDSGLARVSTKGHTWWTMNGTIACGDDINGREAVSAYFAADKKVHPENYAKWGIINEKGEEVLPVVYDAVWNFCGKYRYSTRIEKDGQISEIYFWELNPLLSPNHNKNHCYCRNDKADYSEYDEDYSEYEGTYAHSMGYSDDVIDDAFDGEPGAYWNID